MQSVLLNDQYQRYLTGAEVEGNVHLLQQQEIHAGDTVLVYYDALDMAEVKAVCTPQSAFAGVKGVITRLGPALRSNGARKIQRVAVRKLSPQ